MSSPPWRKTTSTRQGTATMYGAADYNKLMDLLNGIDTTQPVDINNDWNFTRQPTGLPPAWNANSTETLTNKTISAALNKILQVSQSYYYVFIDTNDGNKFKARNNTTGVIDYTSAGSTDATTVIQNAINAAAGVGSVFLNAGTYPVSGSSPVAITLPSSSHLTASSPINTKIQTLSQLGVLGNSTRSGGGNSNILVENLWLDGAWDGSSAQTMDNCGVLLDFVADVAVRNCKVTNAKAEGIKCRNSARATIERCYVNKTPLGCAGMIIASNSTYGKILANTCIDSGGESYSAVSDGTGTTTSNVVIANNVGYVTSNSANTRGHILIEALSPGIAVNDIVVTGNTIVAGSANCIIISNASSGAGGANVGSRNIVISNNVLTHFSPTIAVPGAGGCGINSSCCGINIIGNYIHDVLQHGIITSSGNSRVNISGNVIRNIGVGSGQANIVDGINNTSTGFALYDNNISNNIIIDEGTNMRYGINMAGTNAHTNMSIQGNSIRGNQTTPAIVTGAYSSATNIKIADNPGHVSENRGSNTQSQTVSTNTAFNIPHGCASGLTPVYVDARPVTSDARGSYTLSADATNIIITYPIPPPTGTNNLQWYWSAGILYS